MHEFVSEDGQEQLLLVAWGVIVIHSLAAYQKKKDDCHSSKESLWILCHCSTPIPVQSKSKKCKLINSVHHE